MNNKPDRYCVIMAGGIGSRFWPISRQHRPKQFLDILGTGRTFIRQTFERFRPLIEDSHFLVVTNDSYRDLVLEQLPELAEDQVLTEPIGRNTAPCIAYAACRLRAVNPDATMIVTPADHLILDEQEFRKAIVQSAEFVEREHTLMTIGIQPSRPDTGYGYIQTGIDAEENINKVKTFTEKPKLEMAKVFLESGDFFWNSGIFIWENRAILEALSKFLPENQQIFAAQADKFNTPQEKQAINEIYPACRNISIDFGVMEKADNVYVRRSDFGWSDIGTWNSLYSYSEKDDKGNSCSGNILTYNTSNCIIKSPKDKVVVVDSLDGYIVVSTDDAVMICPKENEQNVKMFIDDIKYKTGGSFN